MKIWQKMILKDLLKTLIFILLCFYLLYAMMDYSMHMRNFQSASLGKILLYYFYHFIKRLDLLLPIAFLISLIRCLEGMNKNNELLALQVASLSFQTLVRPLFFLSLSLSCLMYINYEWALPQSMNFIDAFQATHIKKTAKDLGIQSIRLKDGGQLIYQHYNRETKTYSEIFYLPSLQNIYHIKSLHEQVGAVVDQFEKNEQGFYELTHSFPSYHFENLVIPTKKPQPIPLDNWKISSLIKLTLSSSNAEALSKLFYKCLTPLFSLLIMWTLVPYSFTFERGRSPLSLYVYGLFGFMSYFMLTNFAKILGSNGFISPFISFPFLILAPILLSLRKRLNQV
ncbi:MAG: LptF/LptG family permease [Simkaniaceae bacterium]|nr:LptF/LptG family permease [Simkaniaceae bacterium]